IGKKIGNATGNTDCHPSSRNSKALAPKRPSIHCKPGNDSGKKIGKIGKIGNKLNYSLTAISGKHSSNKSRAYPTTARILTSPQSP
ncbi:MAG TPA: hypothetical protein VF510_04505, partial [Ktedonobacterales bacterium]